MSKKLAPIGIFAGAFAAAFGLGLAVREIFDSRPAGAVTFILIVLVGGIAARSGALRDAQAVGRFLVVSLVGALVVGVAALVIAPPYGGLVGFLLFSPLLYYFWVSIEGQDRRP